MELAVTPVVLVELTKELVTMIDNTSFTTERNHAIIQTNTITSSEGPSQNVGNEVAQWMEMLPPNVLEQLELHSIKGMSRPHRDTIDGLDVEEFHHKCSEKLLQAVDILTEVIIMHNSLSAHLGSSIPAIHAVDINCASQNQLKDAKKKEHTECSSSMGHQAGENLWDIEKALEDSSNLTPESLEYMAGSNFNIWLESNDFDLESPSSLGSSLGTYDVDEAVS
ncbi:hypothetical protein PENVUL_c006G04133 [Penicillium vulpinum]|uniref:Uncharacterized protein n=1 Tax=Penicillium vulpinum TaxID=29845 RepID=A0A1V6S6G4_9EURO|nr:hypothetical protein PENVUL_c006G04133 [Penicillium vulpinum]